MSFEEQIMRLKDLEGIVVEAEEINELNAKFKIVYSGGLPPSAVSGMGKRPWEALSVRLDMIRLWKDLGPYMAHGPDEFSTYVLKEHAETHDRPLEIFKKEIDDRGIGAKGIEERVQQ